MLVGIGVVALAVTGVMIWARKRRSRSSVASGADLAKVPMTTADDPWTETSPLSR
jgi:uncharacterized iron-regulated membrane protein